MPITETNLEALLGRITAQLEKLETEKKGDAAVKEIIEDKQNLEVKLDHLTDAFARMKHAWAADKVEVEQLRGQQRDFIARESETSRECARVTDLLVNERKAAGEQRKEIITQMIDQVTAMPIGITERSKARFMGEVVAMLMREFKMEPVK